MSNEIYYDNNVYNDYSDKGEFESDKLGFAVTSLVLGILNILCFCCGLGFIAAPLSIIFGAISLAKHYGGKIMSIIGIVLSTLSILGVAILFMMCKDFVMDYTKFIENYEAVVEEYEETGELPDYIEKYDDPKYDEFYQSGGYEDFYDFFDALITEIDASIEISNTEVYSDEEVDLG